MTASRTGNRNWLLKRRSSPGISATRKDGPGKVILSCPGNQPVTQGGETCTSKKKESQFKNVLCGQAACINEQLKKKRFPGKEKVVPGVGKITPHTELGVYFDSKKRGSIGVQKGGKKFAALKEKGDDS